MARNIIALVDFSSVTDDILRAVSDLATRYGAKCWLLHIAAPDPDFVGYDVGPQYIRDSRASVLREEHQKLMAYKNDMTSKGIECEALLVQGPLYKTIEFEMEKLEADLVVLGSHGRSMFYEVLVGSVCEYLLRTSKVPLMVIPAKD